MKPKSNLRSLRLLALLLAASLAWARLIGWIIGALLLLAGGTWGFYKAYMWTHPLEDQMVTSEVLQLIAEPTEEAPDGVHRPPISNLLRAPDGWTYKPVPMLTSTNLVHWETWTAPILNDGLIRYQDGTVLAIEQEQDPVTDLWNRFRLILVSPGTNGVRFFKMPF
jgi:hypothetical protein